MNHIILNFLLIALLMSGCSFQPLYSSKNFIDLEIREIEYLQNNEINDLLDFYLKRSQNYQSNNAYDVVINSTYEKIAREKDGSGKITQYEIIVNVNFQLSNGIKNFDLDLRESILMNSYSNKIEEERYEKTIKKNLVRNILNKFEIRIRQLQ